MNRAEYINHLFNHLEFINKKIDSMGKTLGRNKLIIQRDKEIATLRQLTDVKVNTYKQEEKILW